MPIFTAGIMTRDQLAGQLTNVVMASVRHIRGGLAISTAAACTMFGAVPGPAQASVVAIGSSLRPQILQAGYEDCFLLALIVIASGITFLIPLSIGMIICGVVSSISIAELFIGGIGPGLLILLLLKASTYVYAACNSLPAEPKANWVERLAAKRAALWPMGFPVTIPMLLGVSVAPIFFPQIALFLRDLESSQITGSFKLRGAANAVLPLTGEQRAAGGVGFSTANQGRGLAYAAAQAGVQAKLQLKAMPPVRGTKKAVSWARDEAKAEAEAGNLHEEPGVEISVSTGIAQAVSSADIVVTTTPAPVPGIKAEWLQPGHLLIATGPDQEHKCELEPVCLAKPDAYVPGSQTQCSVKCELRSAIGAGLISKDCSFTELGDITAGKATGLQSDGDLIIAGITGIGVQDPAIATLAGARADAVGAGTTFTS
ncbi:TRAP transporter large permease subunit [Leisingera methylohalidivorans]|uniref:TRAP transporter large permease subunit n=1 Tax=Leisingera methylohalidivorans TaxID=133924 RepID=UPI000421BC8F|nr:TRAP transporter large permease subunit [Leisingera methylohalidivorans]